MNERYRPGKAACDKELPVALTKEQQAVLKRRVYWDQWKSPAFGGSEKRNLIDSHQEDSMNKSQPIYTKEFKQQAISLFETSGKIKTQIDRDLGISDSDLSKWCK